MSTWGACSLSGPGQSAVSPSFFLIFDIHCQHAVNWCLFVIPPPFDRSLPFHRVSKRREQGRDSGRKEGTLKGSTKATRGREGLQTVWVAALSALQPSGRKRGSNNNTTDQAKSKSRLVVEAFALATSRRPSPSKVALLLFETCLLQFAPALRICTCTCTLQ